MINYSLSSKHDAKKTFEKVFSMYYPKMLTFIAGLTSDYAEAEDIVEDIFVSILEKENFFENISDVDSYLFITCRNAAVSWLKKHQKKTVMDQNWEGKNDWSPEDQALGAELLQYINAQIAAMPEQRRRVFIMSRIDGMSNGEIANCLGISKRTVENHIYAAMAELKQKIFLIVLVLTLFE